jgi:3-dehydroquinate synthetase
MAEPSNETILALIQQGMKHQNEKLEQILEQTTRTNGRVTKVEEEIEEVQKWMIKKDNTTTVNKFWLILLGGGVASLIGWVVEYVSNKH